MSWRNLFEKILFDEIIEEAPDKPENTFSADYAIWRLWHAKRVSPYAIQDHAALIRQCLRWLSPYRIRGDRFNEPERQCLMSVGVSLSISGYLEVEPYSPDWLTGKGDNHDLDALPSPACVDESFPAEGWLKRVTGKTKWRSQAQKEACWSIIKALPGSTHLIGLPTGAGKSLVFQVAAGLSTGLMVVVVPTVSLALDQLANSKMLPTAAELNPAAYISRGDSDSVRDLVAKRQCRLLFTSPEACVSGRLRSVLDQLSSDGWLQWVVVDEAHIVESWGADFRIEFQLLGALVRDWRRRSRSQLRTLLLSATFAESTRALLHGLFVEQGQQWNDSIVQRLRPEIHYYVHFAATLAEKNICVEDAIKYLSRPLILYVTERDEAKTWYSKIKGLGFSRVACFHGDTKQTDRERIMEEWRSDSIDIIVATSAFGLGVDKLDVRAVVHACFPESIDRFYQEVGRGGRDGASTQSVMVYTEKDKRVGKKLSPTLLRSDTVNDRWLALWNTRREFGVVSGEFQLRCDARRKEFLGKRTYQENVRWNKRLLQMLHRAKLLVITGLVSEKNEEVEGEYVEWVSIKDLQFPSVDTHVGDRLSDEREKEIKVIDLGFKALERCANGEAVCCELQKYYSGHVTRACGSCIACREGREQRRECGSLLWPEDNSPTNSIVKVVPMVRVATPKSRADWIMAFRRCINESVADRFVVTNEDFDSVESLMLEAIGSSSILKPYRLDSLDDDKQPFVKIDEHIVAIHPKLFRPELSYFNHFGQVCSHWIPMEDIEDAHGRSRFTQEHSARMFDGLDTWLFENRPIFKH